MPSKALFDKFAKLIMGAVDDTAKVFLLSLRSVLVRESENGGACSMYVALGISLGHSPLRMSHVQYGGQWQVPFGLRG